MSAPARRLETARSGAAPRPLPDDRRPHHPQRAAPPARPPAARPLTSTPSHPRRRARRGLHPVFMLFSAVVVTMLIVGLVSISAMAVQTSFAVETVQERIAALNDRTESLTNDVAAFSSPHRVAKWARERAMVAPSDVEVLTVGGGSA